MEDQSTQKPDGNIIYVGSKNVMSYVLAIVTKFNQGSTEIQVKARGAAISRAVDATQIAKHRFINTLEITGFKVTTEELQSEDGSNSRVSSVTLTLKK
ncbi:DNA-binding protein Alba [Candidatus Micrarchaeota archaeon]|nr:DNA-binding protein Alba [Candidatus Micrarchaeota archaeon]